MVNPAGGVMVVVAEDLSLHTVSSTLPGTVTATGGATCTVVLVVSAAVADAVTTAEVDPR